MMGHQPHEIGRVRLAWPYRQHLLARHFGPVRVAGAPGGASAFHRLGDIDFCCGVGARRDCHGLGLTRSFGCRPREVQQLFQENTLRREIGNSLPGKKRNAALQSQRVGRGWAPALFRTQGKRRRRRRLQQAGPRPASAVQYVSCCSFHSIVEPIQLTIVALSCAYFEHVAREYLKKLGEVGRMTINTKAIELNA